jgi:hypothetical protein
LTVPLPIPELAEVTVSHEVLLEEAVHAHPFCVDTVTAPEPPGPLSTMLGGVKM